MLFFNVTITVDCVFLFSYTVVCCENPKWVIDLWIKFQIYLWNKKIIFIKVIVNIIMLIMVLNLEILIVCVNLPKIIEVNLIDWWYSCQTFNYLKGIKYHLSSYI